MKNNSIGAAGFAELQSGEMEEIGGGGVTLPKPSWWWLAELFVENFDDIQKGLRAGWNYPDKK
jgi:hypothetical protein